MFPRAKRSGKYTYLQIVESRWVDGKVRQQVIASLGRLDKLVDSGRLDGLTRGLARFCREVEIVNAMREGDLRGGAVRRLGPALVFERLWHEVGMDTVVTRLLEGRRFGFNVERAIFLTVLHRLFTSGSDRAAERWREDYALQGVEALELHQLYRAMGWLGQALPEQEQAGSTPFSPRCVKDLIEEALFVRRQDLFTNLDVVFFDTTSIYFEGEGGDTIGRRGKSKDHRPDLKQMVVGAVLDGEGRPVCCELWPGNTTDVKTLLPIVEGNPAIHVLWAWSETMALPKSLDTPTFSGPDCSEEIAIGNRGGEAMKRPAMPRPLGVGQFFELLIASSDFFTVCANAFTSAQSAS